MASKSEYVSTDSKTKSKSSAEGTAQRRTSNAVPRGFSSYYDKVDPEYYEKYGVSNDVGSTIKVVGKEMKVIGVAYPKEQFEGFINEETVFITDNPETPVVIKEKDGIKPVDIEKVRSQVKRERAKWFNGRPISRSSEGATVNYIENHKGVKIYQRDNNKKYTATVYTESFEEKDLKTLKAKIDKAKNEHIKKYRNLD